MTAAIQVDHLSFNYADRPILRDVSVQVPEGKFTVLLGQNGSGKSTLLRIVSGTLGFDLGTVLVLGEDLGGLSSGQRARLVGYLPQHHRPVFPFSVQDVVLTGRASYVVWTPKKEDEEKAVRALERVGILHLRWRPFTELSGGEQQMVRIARVLAQEPRLVLLDEPTSHLDFLNQSKLLNLVRELVDARLTVLAVLHDPNSAFLYGDHFLLLKGGVVQELDPAQQAWDRQVLERLYDAELETIPYGQRAIVVPQVRRVGGPANPAPPA